MLKAQNRTSKRRTCGGARVAAAGVLVVLQVGCSDLKLSGGQNLQQQSILSVFSKPGPEQAARWAADPYDPDKRQRGMLMLANAPWGGGDVYLRFYTQALEDEDAAVRAVACRAMGRHGADSDVPLVLAHLSDPESIVRLEATKALQRLHNPVAIGPLLSAVNPRSEDDAETRAAAGQALGQYADHQVVQGLIGALRDRRLLVNQAALDSLALLTGQDFGFDVGAWLQWTTQTDDLFAGRGLYVYPVYHRDYRFLEYFIPWMQPPNETASTPAGLTTSPQANSTQGG